MSKQTVEKAGPEEAAILSDLQAAIEQLKQLMTAQPSVTPAPAPPVAAAAHPPAAEETEEERQRREQMAASAAAAKAETPSEGATGRDTADERIADIPPEDQESLTEIKRSLATIHQALATLAGDGGVAKTVAQVVARMGMVEKAFDNVLRDLGIAEQIETAYGQPTVQPTPTGAPVQPLQVPSTVVKSGPPLQAGGPDQFVQVLKDLESTVGTLQQRLDPRVATDLPPGPPSQDKAFKSAMVDVLAHPDAGRQEAAQRALQLASQG